MPRTRSFRRVKRVVSGFSMEVRYGADSIDFAGAPRQSKSVAQVAKKSSWVDALVGIFDDSPLSAQILENERRARETMDSHFVMPE